MKANTTAVYYSVIAINEFTSEVPYLAYYLFRNLGLGYSFLYVAIHSATIGVLDYPTGGLADRYGRKGVFASGLALVGFSFMLVALFTHPATVVISGFLAGFGAALQSGSLEAWVVDELRAIKMDAELDSVFGRGTSFALLGDVLAGIVSSLITFLYGYWWTIPIAGITAIAASCLSLAIMSENRGLGGGEKERYWELLKEGSRWIYRKRTLLLLGLCQAFFIAGTYSYWETLMPVYGERGIPEAFFGLLGSAMHLPAVVTAAYVHRMTRRIGLARTALMISWAWTGSCVLVMIFTDPTLTVTLVIFLESAFATRYPVIEFWRNTLIPSNMRATVLSGMSTFVRIGQSLALFALTPFVQTEGTVWGLLAAVALTGISNLLLSFAMEKSSAT